MANINVTPLVDVVLVLLIIFMVVTPLIASGVPVELPKTVHHNRKPDDGKDIIISVTADKRIFMSGRPVADARDITRLVEEERRRHPEKRSLREGRRAHPLWRRARRDGGRQQGGPGRRHAGDGRTSKDEKAK